MNKEFCVKGMHCHSCEVIIERKLKKVKGITKVNVDRKHSKIELECDCECDASSLQKCLPDTYTILNDSSEVDEQSVPLKKRFVEIGASIVLILGVFLILKYFDLLPSGFGISEGMSYGFILIIGLVASTSTCLAVSGGLLLAITSKFNEAHPELTGWQRFKPHVYFNLGRIISYGLLGGLVGLIGSFFTLSLVANGVITLLASVLMIVIGLQLLHIFLFLNHIQIKLPKFLAHKIHDASESEEKKYSNVGAFLFGGLTFFLPCGFTQALQLYVLAQGSFVQGFFIMLAFAIGTLPVLATIGAITSFAKGAFQRHLTTFSAVLIILLGLFSIQYGLALAGIGVDEPVVDLDLASVVDGVQILEMKVVGLEYFPHQFKVQKDIPVKWIIDGSGAQGCGQVMTVPKLGVTKSFTDFGPTIVEFTPTETGPIVFSCAMGMTTKGAVIEVVDAT